MCELAFQYFENSFFQADKAQPPRAFYTDDESGFDQFLYGPEKI